MALTGVELVSRDTLGDRVADLLRRKILHGDIPEGTRLVEEELATQLGTSRQPLRYAFQVLEREGLVITNRGRGTYVATFTTETYRELNDVRTNLEVMAFQLASRRMADEGKRDLENLAEILEIAAQARDLQRFVETDMGIHRKIWELSGNHQLERILNYFVGPGMTMMQLHLESHPDDIAIYLSQHLQLVEAVTSGDERVAVSAVISIHAHLASPLERDLSEARHEPAATMR